jgi:hypothetical protein
MVDGTSLEGMLGGGGGVGLGGGVDFKNEYKCIYVVK